MVSLAGSVTITLMHVNDIHAHFEEVNVNTGRCKGSEVWGDQGVGAITFAEEEELYLFKF